MSEEQAPNPVSTETEDQETSPANTEIVAPDSTLALFQEALAELELSERDDAKAVIAARIREVQRLRILLAKAERDLAQLQKKTPAEIAMLRF